MAFISKRKKVKVLSILLAELSKDLMIYKQNYGDLTEEQRKEFEKSRKETKVCLIKDLAK